MDNVVNAFIEALAKKLIQFSKGTRRDFPAAIRIGTLIRTSGVLVY
jgi:hypothetical protein